MTGIASEFRTSERQVQSACCYFGEYDAQEKLKNLTFGASTQNVRIVPHFDQQIFSNHAPLIIDHR